MGEWSSFGHCVCDKGTCGTCRKESFREITKQCAHGGDCTCRRESMTADCSKPCRKIAYKTFSNLQKNTKILKWLMWMNRNVIKLLFLEINCVMGEWTNWSSCICIHGTCGRCERLRESSVLVRCANGGRCDCKRKEEAQDCSIPCST